MFTPIKRRTFLKSAAGALIPLPFLNAMEASADPGPQGKPPQRFVALFKPNGVHPPSWNIAGGAEFDFKMAPMMMPFSKHRDDLILLDSIGDSGFSSHQASAQRFLSGRYRSGGSTSADNRSIDQIIADRIGTQTRQKSLELTTEGLFNERIECSYISYDKSGSPLPRDSDPQLIFDRLFRDPLVNPKKRQQMVSLLDRVGEQTRSLERRVGREDRQTLEAYLTVLRETEKRITKLSKEPIPRFDFAKFERPAIPADINEQVESMLDLIVLSLWTDSTRCVSYMLGNTNSRMVFDFLGVKKQHHYLSHFYRNFSRENLEDLYKVCLWHMEKFDYLLTRMKSFSDHNGTLLDHSVVLFGSGMGHSDSHTAQRIPTVLAGQCGGKLKTGRYLRHDRNQNPRSLHRSLLQLFDCDTTVIQDPSLRGLDGNSFDSYSEPHFDSWSRIKNDQIEAQGRLRLSENLAEANLYFLDISGQPSVEIKVTFKNMQNLQMPFYCGSPVRLRGTGRKEGHRIVITSLSTLDPLTINGRENRPK
ncbi:DUF1552 domain-containing protein [Bremerella sp. P1]|uniref:DUF1552 domain-containing protein n=1 Tax=Bremerella sp. P1 TaxID=3026424 RepID=UPI002367E3FE|nr:DUF1552 domain-containing protein [Bremerella sp. P1]WDI43758.1 DUF1552 domain-containing protein [Bremerella sp. P1]